MSLQEVVEVTELNASDNDVPMFAVFFSYCSSTGCFATGLPPPLVHFSLGSTALRD